MGSIDEVSNLDGRLYAWKVDKLHTARRPSSSCSLLLRSQGLETRCEGFRPSVADAEVGVVRCKRPPSRTTPSLLLPFVRILHFPALADSLTSRQPASFPSPGAALHTIELRAVYCPRISGSQRADTDCRESRDHSLFIPLHTFRSLRYSPHFSPCATNIETAGRLREPHSAT